MNGREREELEEVLALLYEGEKAVVDVIGSRPKQYVNARNRVESLLEGERPDIPTP